MVWDLRFQAALRYSPAMRILVVEDEQHIAHFAKSGLESAGFCVDLCADGDEGFLLTTTQQYDVIVLDIMLPGRDGTVWGRDVPPQRR